MDTEIVGGHRSLRRRLLRLAYLSVVAAPLAAHSAEKPRVIPMPGPPPGPEIRRVTHVAPNRPLNPGSKLTITVVTEAGARVTASLGSAVREISCQPEKNDPGTFTCAVVLPDDALGVHRARAQAVDAKGRVSSLSAALPVVVERYIPWRETDALNVRLAPALFSEGSADLDPASRSALSLDLDLLKTHSRFPIVLEGRCDASEPGDLPALSARRGEAVRDELVALGIPKERIRISALAATQPLTASRDESERATNRSVLLLFEPLPAPKKP